MWQRFSLIFRSKANKVLDKAEDPRETLDYSYQRQLDLLAKVRRGVADVATRRKRVELQVNQLTAQSDKLQGQAEQAITVGREDLAREALTRKSGPHPADRRPARPSRRSSRARRRSSTWPRSGCRPRSRRSARARRRSRRRTPRPRRRRRSTRRCRASPRRWATSAWRSSGPRTRPPQMQARAGAVDELIASGALDDASSLNARRRHLPRARVDELAVRRRGRAGQAQGRQAPEAIEAGDGATRGEPERPPSRRRAK